MCEKCDELKNDDYDPCNDTKDYDAVCENCLMDIEEEEEAEYQSMKKEYLKEKGKDKL